MTGHYLLHPYCQVLHTDRSILRCHICFLILLCGLYLSALSEINPTTKAILTYFEIPSLVKTGKSLRIKLILVEIFIIILVRITPLVHQAPHPLDSIPILAQFPFQILIDYLTSLILFLF